MEDSSQAIKTSRKPSKLLAKRSKDSGPLVRSKRSPTVCVLSKPFALPFIHPITHCIITMRTTIAKSLIDAARKSKPLNTRVFTSSSFPHAPTNMEDAGVTKRSYSNHEDDYYLSSSLESTLERVLEMTQLGKEESIHWATAVRSAYKTEYLEEDWDACCHLCGCHKSAHGLCHRCLKVESSKSGASTSVQTSDSFTRRPSYAP